MTVNIRLSYINNIIIFLETASTLSFNFSGVVIYNLKVSETNIKLIIVNNNILLGVEIMYNLCVFIRYGINRRTKRVALF